MRKFTFITLMMILGISSVISSCDNFKNSSNNKENFSNLYKWVLSDGVKWKTFGVIGEQVQYEGETWKGIPHGLGYTYWVLKGKYRYYGEWKNGIKHGDGKFQYSKRFIEGEWKDGDIWNGTQKDQWDSEITGTYEKGVFKKVE
jgi:hypothetical protein